MSDLRTTPAAPFQVPVGLYSAVWAHLPFPGAKKPGQQRRADDFTAPTEGSHLLGTPIFFPITIGGVKLPNAPLITVTGSKNIVKTVIAGGDGTVKEIIGLDDYKISIRGFAVREQASGASSALVPDGYPEEWQRTLANLYKQNRALPVICQLLSYWNIERVVIEDINLPAVEGAWSYIPYEINMISDTSSLAKLTSSLL